MDMRPPIGKTYIKTLIREIRQSIGRFLAIFAIVALGVGFLAGIMQSTPDMRASVDSYYRKNNMADIFIKSTLGLTEEDLKEVSSHEGVKSVMPAYVTDAIMDTSGDESLVTRIYGLPLDHLNSQGFVNNLTLVEGRLPEKQGECLAQRVYGTLSELSLGSTLAISSQNSDYEDMADTYSVMEYTVVGIVENPFYISVESEPTTIGSGHLGAVVYVDESSYLLDVYTDFYITLSDTEGLTSFTSHYEDYSQSLVQDLEFLSKKRCSIRYADVLSDAKEELAEGKKSYEEAKQEAEQKLAEAWDKLLSAKAEIQTGEKKLENGRKQLEEGKATLLRERASYKKEISSAKDTLAAKEKELAENRQSLEAAKAMLDASKASIEKARSLLQALKSLPVDINDQIAAYDEAVKYYQEGLLQLEQYPDNEELKLKLEQLKAQIDTNASNIEQARSILQAAEKLPADIDDQILKYDASLESYEKAMAQVLDGEAQLSFAWEQLENKAAEAEKAFKSAQNELNSSEATLLKSEATLTSSKQKLEQGFEEYYSSKADAEEKLQDAASEIQDAEKSISEIAYPEWYVLDRGSNVSYVSYKLNVNKVEEIARVFPIFFLLVAGLVALTTMTRMIEEERTQIGTLKALGYSRPAIISKYMVYCGLASLLGSILGLLVGFQLLPRVIYLAYATMYTLPPLKALFSWSFAIIACFSAVFITTGATYLACRHTLREKPARLMLPMAPKAGKRIFLERIRFIWTKLSFNYKSTARNLFRYKKHFFMTVTGIAGCTALMMTGLGLMDSLNCISDTQYDELFKYDLTISLNEDANIDELIKRLSASSLDLNSYVRLHIETASVETGSRSVSINLFAADENSSLKDFINLRYRKSHKGLDFNQNSVILTEKLSQVLGVGSGDTIPIEFKDGTTGKITITGITENYVGSYIYMGSEAYKAAYGTLPSANSIIASTGIHEKPKQDAAAELMLSDDNVSGVSFASQTRGSFENLLSSVVYIVAVVIVAAGALAVIVLYNLTNININERRKELATLKVLGFHDREVAAYIYREIVLLTIIGTLAGLGIGVLLHAFVINRAESTDLMFGRTIKPMSFILSAAFTMLFSAFVDLIMYKKLKDIEMVDSMKAVD